MGQSGASISPRLLEKHAGLMNSFVKANGRILPSIFEYDHSEHPALPFAVTEDETVNLYIQGELSSPRIGIQEFTAKEFYDTFHTPADLFPVLALSQFSWKLFLLVKL